MLSMNYNTTIFLNCLFSYLTRMFNLTKFFYGIRVQYTKILLRVLLSSYFPPAGLDRYDLSQGENTM
jgi:hypothetical protein